MCGRRSRLVILWRCHLTSLLRAEDGWDRSKRPRLGQGAELSGITPGGSLLQVWEALVKVLGRMLVVRVLLELGLSGGTEEE
eukprot:362740-Chlamydomonas_euryale.AAC.2